MASGKHRDELVFLEDMVDSMEKIIAYTSGITEKQFDENFEKQDAVIRRIEILGEAVKNLSMETRAKYPIIPWRKIAGMRDIVIHQYFGVSLSMIWLVATIEVPLLYKQLENIIQELEGE